MIDYNDYNTIIGIKKNPTYENCVIPLWDKFKQVILDESDYDGLDVFVQKVVEQKLVEKGHEVDNQKEEKRWTTGQQGEIVVGKFLGLKVADYTVGESKMYNYADLKKHDIKCGIKTVEYGKFPLIKKGYKEPEIIVIKKSKYEFYIAGLATPLYMSLYHSDNLVLDSNLRAKNYKTGFYGFFKLEQFNNIDELKILCND